MNTNKQNERGELLAAVVRERFFEMGQALKKAVQAKQDYKSALAKIEAQKDTYQPEYIEQMKAKAKQDYSGKLTAIHAEVAPKLDSLEKALAEKHSRLDLESPAWVNTLKLIDMGGASLSADVIQKINASFAGDVPSLKALQAVYKSKGIAYDGGLEKQIYDVNSSFENLRKNARQTFTTQETSINTFAGNIGKVAKMEGQEFNTAPDSDGVTEAFARGAGLK